MRLGSSEQALTYHTRQTCRLCLGPLRIVLSLPDTPLANSYLSRPGSQQHYPLYLSECTSCGHVQLPVVVEPSLMFSDYAYTSSTAASFRQHIGKLADVVAGPGSVVVDVGSNDGLLLAEAQRRGAVAVGIDPARNLAAEATSRGQITLPGFLTIAMAQQVRKLIRQATHVTALNVFAHADNLGEIADAVHELIYPSGTFVFEVAYLLDVLEKNEIGTIYHEHLSHHHVAPLVPFLAAHNMTLYRVERIASQGGSIRCFARCGGVADPTVAKAIEGEAGVSRSLENWPERVRVSRSDLMVRIAPYAGRSLAIYGAPARLTTMVYTMALRASDVSCVFDDEPKKIGRFTPGMNWPIVPSCDLMSRAPEAVLISAWPYAEEIKARFPDYRGEWITPRREK